VFANLLAILAINERHNMKPILLISALLLVTPPLHAESHQPGSPSSTQAVVMTDGVVQKIDAVAGKITLKHGAIVNLDMPAMTMVFRAQPPSLLDRVRVSDRVKFHAEQINGTLTVTAIQVAP
jgi:Cu(I)/Ag(I) efflux system protein CusF